MKKKVLLTGASGFLGYHIIQAAQHEFELYGCCFKNQRQFGQIKMFSVDVCSYHDMGNLIDDIEPDFVIHTAAHSSIDFCQSNPSESYAVNVEASANLASVAADWQVPFVFTSTDLVFDGQKGNYKEGDAVNPLMRYGEQKVLAEEMIQKIYPSALIIRLPMLIGDIDASDKNYLFHFLKNTREGKNNLVFTDEYRSSTHAKNIAMGILQFMHTESGLLHLAGSESLSRYEIGQRICDVFSINQKNLIPITHAEALLAVPRPKDVSLAISKAQLLGYKASSFIEDLLHIYTTNIF